MSWGGLRFKWRYLNAPVSTSRPCASDQLPDENMWVPSPAVVSAGATGAEPDEKAGRLLGIAPNDGPERALAAVESHLARARWMAEQGFLELLE